MNLMLSVFGVVAKCVLCVLDAVESQPREAVFVITTC